MTKLASSAQRTATDEDTWTTAEQSDNSEAAGEKRDQFTLTSALITMEMDCCYRRVDSFSQISLDKQIQKGPIKKRENECGGGFTVIPLRRSADTWSTHRQGSCGCAHQRWASAPHVYVSFFPPLSADQLNSLSLSWGFFFFFFFTLYR